jgi:sugar phosphate isomerase/epimerase
MKLGIDSYSFHRLFGDVRGEEADLGPRPYGNLDVIAAAKRLGAESVALQTCFLDFPSAVGAAELRTALDPLELVVAWGHPEGLSFGTAAAAADELHRWIEVAPALGCGLVRLVAGNRRTERRGLPIEFLANALRGPVEAAAARGIRLALENHADLTVAELELLISLVDDPVLGICLDTANAVRVGDDPLQATLRLLPHVRMVHLKDVAGGAFEASAGPRSVPYGTGVIPVRQILDTLKEAEFDGHVVVELGYLGGGQVDEEELLTTCFQWLLGALGRPRLADTASGVDGLASTGKGAC